MGELSELDRGDLDRLEFDAFFKGLEGELKEFDAWLLSFDDDSTMGIF